MSAAEEGLVYELVLPRMDNVEGLTLVPEYSKSGEHPDEAISIEKLPDAWLHSWHRQSGWPSSG